MLPAFGVAPKFNRPARKSWLATLSVLATNPATSTFAPCPTMMPAGFPSHTEGSLAMTRLRTLLLADAWLNRVVSFAPMEKLFQLMMAPFVLLTVSRLPDWLKLALPLITCGPIGLDQACALAKQAEIAATIMRLRLEKRVLVSSGMVYPLRLAAKYCHLTDIRQKQILRFAQNDKIQDVHG